MASNSVGLPAIDDAFCIDLPSMQDDRGMLTAVEGEKDVKFAIQRVFYMHGVKQDRGGHAHLDTEQLVIAVSGSFTVELFDGHRSRAYVLDNPAVGLFVPRRIFVTLSEFSGDAVCLVLASDHYDMSRSVRSRHEYVQMIAGTREEA